MPTCALIFAPAAYSQEPITSRKDVEVALERAVNCNVDALGIFSGSRSDGGPDDAGRQLEKLGITIPSETKHEGEMRYRFPTGIKIFGYEVSEALFSSNSVTTFFVTLHASPDRLRTIDQILKLVPVPGGNAEGYGYFGEIEVRYIRKFGAEKDMPPDTIFSGTAHNGNSVVIGCQNLAW